MLGRKEIKSSLDELAERLGAQVIYGDLNYPGGYCRSRGRFYIIINNKLALEEKVRLLCEGVSQLPWEDMELPGEIQNLLIRKGT